MTRVRARSHVVGYWVWELPVLPAVWAPALDLVDEIWTPSSFVADVYNEITKKPVRIIPHAVPPNEISREAGRQFFGLPQDRFIFLSAFDTESYFARKNPEAAVRAFRDAFPAFSESSPLMVLKLHGMSAKAPELDRLLQEVKGLPSFRVIDASLDEDGIRHLQAACDCFVSLHRSEGFGLNIAECMAAGRVAIVTDHSGNRDFARDDNSLPIPFGVRVLKRGEYPIGTGQWWAEPSHEAATEAMRWVVANPSAAALLAEKARRDIATDYSYERIGALAVAALTGARPWARPLASATFAAQASPSATQRAAKIGRNDPCPCGSGKKYKNCHGANL